MIQTALRRLSGWDRLSWEQKSLIRYRIAYRAAAFLSFFPVPLRKLFQLFGSDKDSAGGHAYGTTYGRLFSEFRFKKIKILEIGIGGYEFKIGGNSLLAWRAYFPLGRIIGCDIIDKSSLQIGKISASRIVASGRHVG